MGKRVAEREREGWGRIINTEREKEVEGER